MPNMTIWIDERAYRALQLRASRDGRDPEDLASAAVENEISRCREYDDVLPLRALDLNTGGTNTLD